MNERILIVEDDDSIRMLLEVALSSNGYSPIGFDNASDALDFLKSEVPELAIFDIMMNGINGLEAVRLIRTDDRLKGLPIIMLTAKDTELDKIVGLDAGADDYVTKPFSVLELCARVRAQLRRKINTEELNRSDTVLESGRLKMDCNLREVSLNESTILLTYKEFELLKLLMENPNRTVTRNELIAKIWGNDFCGETRTLDIHIGTLRQKLGDTAENSKFIKTVRSVGYRFVGGCV